MSRIALLLLLAFGALTGTAHAGGWATVELGQAPGSLSTDEPWRVELIVKQHGVTPMDGLKPTVEITNEAGVVKTFPASPAGRTGTYVADVTFPSAGTWRTRFYDGFTDVSPHRLSPMTVSGASASADSGFPWAQATMSAVVALLFLAAIVAVSDRPRLRLGTVTLRGRAA